MSKTRVGAAVATTTAVVLLAVSPAFAGGSFNTYKTCYGITNTGKEIASHVRGSGTVRGATPRASQSVTSASNKTLKVKDPELKEGTVTGSTTLNWSWGNANCDW